jgi:hypothetical protein
MVWSPGVVKDEQYYKILNEQRFIRRVDFLRVFHRDKDCWIWTSTTLKKERFTRATDLEIPVFATRDIRGKETNTYARRFAWEMHYGEQVGAGLVIINTCGDDKCVSPYHSVKCRRSEMWEAKVKAGIRIGRPRQKVVVG